MAFFHWWLVRVTFVVGLVFLPQNFGPMVGTYDWLLLFCECRWGGESMWRWWGHLHTTCCTPHALAPLVPLCPSCFVPSNPHALTPLAPHGWEGTRGVRLQGQEGARARGHKTWEGARAWGMQGCKGCEGMRGVRAQGHEGMRVQGHPHPLHPLCPHTLVPSKLCTLMPSHPLHHKGGRAQGVWGYKGRQVQGLEGARPGSTRVGGCKG